MRERAHGGPHEQHSAGAINGRADPGAPCGDAIRRRDPVDDAGNARHDGLLAFRRGCLPLGAGRSLGQDDRDQGSHDHPNRDKPGLHSGQKIVGQPPAGSADTQPGCEPKAGGGAAIGDQRAPGGRPKGSRPKCGRLSGRGLLGCDGRFPSRAECYL